MTDLDERIKRVSLIDCSEPFVGLVAKLGSAHAQTPAEDLRATAERLLMDLERDAQRMGVAMTEIEAAKYALAALLDEKILCAEFAASAEWINEPLQVRLFGTFAGGEEFYQRIEGLRRDPMGPRLLALEVYHLCLGLGFKGRYDDRRGEEQRKLIMDQIAEQLSQARGAGSGLSPNAYLPPAADMAVESGGWWLRLPLWAYPAAALGLVVLTVMLMALIVGSAAADVRELVAGG